MYRYPAWFALIFSIIGISNAFIISSPTHNTINGIRPTTLTLSSSSFNEDGPSPAQKKQEQMMESSSIAGAKEIRKLDIQERTKRAMLAEAVEDRIFDLVEELEILVKKNGGIENLSGDIKEEAVAMAEQTKALQIQYDDLVNGRPSQLLDMEVGK